MNSAFASVPPAISESSCPRSAAKASRAWQTTADEILARTAGLADVHPERIPDLLPHLAGSTNHDYWEAYVGPFDRARPDVARIAYEIAITLSQCGGFFHYGSEGVIEAWRKDESGVKALLDTMARIRADRKLPGIDVQQQIPEVLAYYFIDKPFPMQRLAMLEEIGQPGASTYISDLISGARNGDGAYHFNDAHVWSLASRFPLCFGADPDFHKKASLYFMTMEIALTKLGYPATSSTTPPADYRIPQILEGFGILAFAPHVARQLSANHIFRRDDPAVRAIRAATIKAVGLIRSHYQAETGEALSTAHLDGMLYQLSRNENVMRARPFKPFMRVLTLAF